MYEHGWGNAKRTLSVDLSFDGPPQAYAMEALRARAEDFAVLADDRESRTIILLLDQALADGWTPGKLSDEIAQSFSDGVHVYDDNGELQRVIPTDSWSEMVARTELSRAQTRGALALYADAGVQKVMYVTSGGSSVCDECEPLDGEVFNVDDLDSNNTPPLHPGCCCSLTPADEDIAFQSDQSDEEAA